jgi:hypothetical protein
VSILSARSSAPNCKRLLSSLNQELDDRGKLIDRLNMNISTKEAEAADLRHQVPPRSLTRCLLCPLLIPAAAACCYPQGTDGNVRPQRRAEGRVRCQQQQQQQQMPASWWPDGVSFHADMTSYLRFSSRHKAVVRQPPAASGRSLQGGTKRYRRSKRRF